MRMGIALWAQEAVFHSYVYIYIYISCDVDDWDRWLLGRALRTRELCPIFVSCVELLDIHEYSVGLWVVNGPPGNGASQLPS